MKKILKEEKWFTLLPLALAVLFFVAAFMLGLAGCSRKLTYMVTEKFCLKNNYSLFVFEPTSDRLWYYEQPYGNSVIAPDSAFVYGENVLINSNGEIIKNK